MKTTDSSNERKAGVKPSFKDVSRFTRWVVRLDEQDKQLGSSRRKQKWMILLCGMFLFFVLSFIWFPPVQIAHDKLKTPVATDSLPSETTVPLPFEIPADSFEQQLKMRLYENLSEKK